MGEFSHGLAQALGEVGMAARPVENAFEQCLRFPVSLSPALPFSPSQSFRQRRGFRVGKVIQLDAPSDVEGRHAGVTDQVGGCGDAEEAEGEAVELRVLRASVVALANRGEELVGGEGQAADDVDFVNEDDETT